MTESNSQRSDEKQIQLHDLKPVEAIRLTPAEQLAFWEALNAPLQLTPAQIELGRAMRGEN